MKRTGQSDRRVLALLALGAASACASSGSGSPESEWTPLLTAERHADWEMTAFGGEGEIEAEDGLLVFEMGSPLTGLHWAGGELPRWDFELEVSACRLAGTDFFCGLTFPVGESHATLILGGWGGALTGLSCIDGADASMNETTAFIAYEQGREGTELDIVGLRPGLVAGDEVSPGPHAELWRRFWDYANDRELAERAGLRAVHGEAPFTELRPGGRYSVELRASGGLSIRPE